MHVQIFESAKGGYALTEDDTGGCLPADLAPWNKTGSMDLIGPDSVEACAAISQDGYFLTDELPTHGNGEGNADA
jgi:hypothetical protein